MRACVFVGMVIRSTPATILFAIEFVDIKFPFTAGIAEQYQQLINRFLESKCSFVQIYTLTRSHMLTVFHEFASERSETTT